MKELQKGVGQGHRVGCLWLSGEHRWQKLEVRRGTALTAFKFHLNRHPARLPPSGELPGPTSLVVHLGQAV